MKERLDVLLVKRNLAESREKAKALIMSGIVYVNGQKEDKAGTTFDETAPIEVRGNAVKVYSVDVGHGQLAWKLRNDERVVCMEKTNIRYVTHENIPDEIGFSSIDVSFISLTKVLGPVKALLKDDGQVVCLIKPQFEAGREKVGKKGVVRDKAVHLEVIEMVIAFAKSIGFEILNLEFSPIKGPEGNIEYLLHLQNHPEGEDGPVIYEEMPVDPKKIVEEAHAALDKE